MPRPTIKDVALAAGVSKGAVSFALHDRPGVAPATRERILEVARELGWTPSARARALSVSKALAVGLVMARRPETLRADPFFPAFIAGVESVLSDRGYALLLQMVSDPDKERESYRRLASEGRVDGVFVTDLLVADERPALLTEIGLPAVILGPGIQNPYWPVVGANEAPGIVAAVEHLIALGHTRISHVGGPSAVVHGVSRREAWCSTLRAAGLPDSPFVETDFSAEAGAAATRHLLDLDEPPTAVIYANDLMAMAGLSLAVSRGVDVPGQLSIVGFDDTEIAAHLQPALTSVRQDAIAWGRAAATRLLELIDGTEPSPIELAPAALVVRESTGPVSPGAAHAAPSQRRRSTPERGRMEKQ